MSTHGVPRMRKGGAPLHRGCPLPALTSPRSPRLGTTRSRPSWLADADADLRRQGSADRNRWADGVVRLEVTYSGPIQQEYRDLWVLQCLLLAPLARIALRSPPTSSSLEDETCPLAPPQHGGARSGADDGRLSDSRNGPTGPASRIQPARTTRSDARSPDQGRRSTAR
jgi:hypothetical protein